MFPTPIEPTVFPLRPIAHVPGRLRPPSRSRDSIFRQQFVRQREDEQEDARRHRPANAIGCVREDYAVRRARGHIDAVVADAHARDDLQTSIGSGYGGGRDTRIQHAQRVVRRGMSGRQFTHVVMNEFPLEAGRVEQLQRPRIENGRAVVPQRVARNTDAKVGHLECLRCLGCLNA